jgi:GT2 family glycosyltransferase
MVEPIVSVVLGTFNRCDFLKLTVESIRQELASIKHEIIVIDGGSDDGTLTWLIEQKDVITIVQHNRGEWQGKPIERRSWGYFMNLGFKVAQGLYVCMLSDDCLVVPGAIKNGITLFEKERLYGRKIGALAFYWRDWSQANSYHVGYTLGDKLYVNHGMFLRLALQEINYIDENTFFFYNGDGDLCLRLWQHGYEIIESPDSYIEHYPHANIGVRSTNYVCFKQDLKNYLKRWEGIFYDRKKNNCGHIVEKEFCDQQNTGGRFAQLHSDIVVGCPALAQQKTSWMREVQALSWKMKAVLRKIW